MANFVSNIDAQINICYNGGCYTQYSVPDNNIDGIYSRKESYYKNIFKKRYFNVNAHHIITTLLCMTVYVR